jgi:hypothetical protein
MTYPEEEEISIFEERRVFLQKGSGRGRSVGMGHEWLQGNRFTRIGGECNLEP